MAGAVQFCAAGTGILTPNAMNTAANARQSTDPSVKREVLGLSDEAWNIVKPRDRKISTERRESMKQAGGVMS